MAPVTSDTMPCEIPKGERTPVALSVVFGSCVEMIVSGILYQGLNERKMMMKSMVLFSLFILFQAFSLESGVSYAVASPVSVEISATPYVTVSKAHVVQEDNRFKIIGTVTRVGKVHLPGHVDLVLLAEDGTLLEKRRISVPGLNSNRRGRMDIRFVAAFDLSPPAGARAVLRYHTPGAPQKVC
jgi:hypothetical protein